LALVAFLQYSSSEHGKRRPPILKYKHSALKGRELTIHECYADSVLGTSKTQYDSCQRRIKEYPVVTEHPDNPKILVDTGDPGLPFRKFVFRVRSQMMHKVYGGPRNSDSVLSYTWEQKRGGPSGEFEEEAHTVI